MREKEKKVITYLLLFLLIEIIVYIFVIPRLQKSLLSQLDSYNYLRKSLFETKEKNSALRDELAKWEEVPKEVEIIERDYLFPNSIENIRLLLKRLSSNSGIYLGDISYDYEDISDSIIKIKIDFSVMAPYDSLRRFIGEIEEESRFIVLKSINLISTASDIINAKISIFVYMSKKG